MLRIKLNRNKTRIEYEDIRISGEPSISENGDTLRIPTETAINTSHNPFVHFVREDGTIYFHDSRPVVSVNKENEIYADIEPFKDIPVGISSVEKIELKKFPGDYLRSFLRIRLSSNHNNTVYRNYPISETMESPEEFSTEFFPKRCRGDYFLYSGILYRIATVHDGIYKFSDIGPINLKQNLIIHSGDFEEGVKTISCLVPVNANGDDVLDELLWEISGSGSDVMEALLNNRYSMVLIEDNRFYDKGENDDSGRTLINKRPGTRFCFENGNLRVSVPIAEDFATNAFAEDAFNSFAESRKNGAVNEIIDYEKMKFTPCYRGSNGKIQLYNSIKFNINLRDRKGSEDWTVNDENYWFAYNTISQSGRLKKTNKNVSGADIISSLDFEDNDIYYQKNKVKNTFLRISFYNSNDRKTQQLLYSVKLYLDSGRLYGKYIKDVENRPESEGMVVDDWGLGENGLYVDFTCSSSYDTGNTSEGFYLYLFPSNLNEETKGGTIYMKAELNNSKYGYTIPLTLPMKRESGKFKTIGPTSADFPIHYLKKKDEMIYPDMAGIRRDTFIPVSIFSQDNKYYWEFDVDFDGEDSDDLVITLFEPRINGTETITESGGGDEGGGGESGGGESGGGQPLNTYTINVTNATEYSIKWFEDSGLTIEISDAKGDSIESELDRVWALVSANGFGEKRVILTKEQPEITIELIRHYIYIVNVTNTGIYPQYTWYRDSELAGVIKQGIENYYSGEEEDVWVKISAEGYVDLITQIHFEQPVIEVTLTKSSTYTVNITPEKAALNATYEWYRDEGLVHKLGGETANTINTFLPEVWVKITSEGYEEAVLYLNDNNRVIDYEMTEIEPLSIYAVPLVERSYGKDSQRYGFNVGNEHNLFVVLVGNDKNKDTEYNISVVNSESKYRKFYIKSPQINIGDGRSVFVVEKDGYEDGGKYASKDSCGTFSVTGSKNDTAAKFVVRGEVGDQHDYHIRSFGLSSMSHPSTDGKYSSVQYCSYKGGTYSINLYGAADGACMIMDNKTYSYTSVVDHASEEPNDIREFIMANNFARYDAIEKSLVTESYDGEDMIRNMSFNTEWKISKMNYTITENTLGRVRFGAVRLASKASIDGYNTYYDGCEHVRFVLQESQTMKFVFDSTTYSKDFFPTYLNMIGTVDLSQSGRVYEFKKTVTSKSAKTSICFLDDSAISKITVTVSNGETIQPTVDRRNGMVSFITVPYDNNGTYEETFYVKVL